MEGTPDRHNDEPEQSNKRHCVKDLLNPVSPESSSDEFFKEEHDERFLINEAAEGLMRSFTGSDDHHVVLANSGESIGVGPNAFNNFEPAPSSTSSSRTTSWHSEIKTVRHQTAKDQELPSIKVLFGIQ